MGHRSGAIVHHATGNINTRPDCEVTGHSVELPVAHRDTDAKFVSRCKVQRRNE
jgi:hypothetical protein